MRKAKYSRNLFSPGLEQRENDLDKNAFLTSLKLPRQQNNDILSNFMKFLLSSQKLHKITLSKCWRKFINKFHCCHAWDVTSSVKIDHCGPGLLTQSRHLELCHTSEFNYRPVITSVKMFRFYMLISGGLLIWLWVEWRL